MGIDVQFEYRTSYVVNTTTFWVKGESAPVLVVPQTVVTTPVRYFYTDYVKFYNHLNCLLTDFDQFKSI